MVKQSGNDRSQAIRALFKARPYHAGSGKNTVQINLKISKKFAIDLRILNDLTLQIEDTAEFVNYCCEYHINQGIIAAKTWLEGYYSFDRYMGKSKEELDKLNQVDKKGI